MGHTLKIFSVGIVLIFSVLSTLFQFHRHDCLGHASIEIATYELAIGCDDEGSCCNETHQHSHENKICALHLDNIEPGARSVIAPPLFCVLFLPNLFREIVIDNTLGCRSRNHIWNRPVIISESDFISLITPLRGSPLSKRS